MTEMNNNERAKELLEKAFKTWKRDKTVKDQEYRKPTSKKQVDMSQDLINEARNLNPDDEWTLNRIDELQGVVDFNNKKVFTGTKFLLLLGYIIGIVFCFIPAYFFLSASDYTVEKALAIRQDKIEDIQKRSAETNEKILKIKAGSGKYEALTEEKKQEKINDLEKHILKQEKTIADLNAFGAEEYTAKLEKDRTNKAVFRIILGVIYVLASILYKPAKTKYQYEIHKKELSVRSRIAEASANKLGNLWEQLFIQMVVNQPSGYKVVTTYADGHKDSDYRMNIVPIVFMMFSGLAIAWWYSAYVFFYPIIVFIEFFGRKRN